MIDQLGRLESLLLIHKVDINQPRVLSQKVRNLFTIKKVRVYVKTAYK